MFAEIKNQGGLRRLVNPAAVAYVAEVGEAAGEAAHVEIALIGGDVIWTAQSYERVSSMLHDAAQARPEVAA